MIVFLTSTGTDVGKTHVGEALLHAMLPLARLAVWKPLESGLAGIEDAQTDSARLEAAARERDPAATWLQPRAPLGRYRAPLAPPFAAAADGMPKVSRETILSTLSALPRPALVELAGGLYAPLADDLLGVDLVALTPRRVVLLVAPNRLGVLHDVLATARAAAADGVDVDHLCLTAAPRPDLSAITNAGELRRRLDAPVHELPRARPRELGAALRPLVTALHGALLGHDGAAP
jgi:dethiobiotin synthetase